MPKNRMSRFEVFIGTWNTSGEVLATEAGPAGVLRATDTYRWLPGKHFILHEVDARFDDQPTRSVEVVGYDLATKGYFARSFDDQGVSGLYAVELRGLRWRIDSESMRFDGRFSKDGDRLSGLWELKGASGRWQPWIRLMLERS
ncbi:DUF1579 family protein [Uliginosibacterium sp. H1]|uniref:DUF1579 family protein n=1 Tax=Uliginosibacterium sp. H1 TaxID=3114757 RepID=UPI002E195E6B|nr:DUF1579 family protein [Uliginosibacterium sp. H1]